MTTTPMMMDIENRLKGIEDEIKRIKRGNLLISTAAVEELLGFLPPYSGNVRIMFEPHGQRTVTIQELNGIPTGHPTELPLNEMQLIIQEIGPERWMLTKTVEMDMNRWAKFHEKYPDLGGVNRKEGGKWEPYPL